MRYGVDGNGDGRRDPWDVLDALASTASYLQQSGWEAGLPWGMEVRLPSGFDFALVEARLPLARWRALGVRAVEHEDLDGAVMARLWLPAGHQGAVFLLLDNYEVIKVYNQSSSYALAVGLLADRIGGGGGIVAKWPRQALGLSRAQVELLQSRLTALGYEVGGVDGVLGRRTREAFRQWQLDNGVLADGFVSQDSVAVLLGR
ncbi:lytic murein transglycosylase [Rappaport israeli]|uniref:lytic murein transglycosylase n=1 Tax=Rappaport israeli TaxID=1839807 RepID=UPI001300D1EB